MELLFAIASDTFEGSDRPPVPLSRGLSLIAKYASDSGQMSRNGSVSKSQTTTSLALAAATAAAKPAASNDADAATKEATQGATHDQQPLSSVDLQAAAAANSGVPDSTVSPDDVVGIRQPRNQRRATLSSTAAAAPKMPTNTGCSDVYRHYCAAYEVKTNSRVLRILQQHEAHTQTPSNPFQDLTSLDVGLCMLRDRGLLPVVELLRLCTNLRTLNLSGNDLTNEGIEYLAHAVVEGSVTSSFDAPDESDVDSNARQKNVKQRAEGTGGTFINLNTRFGASIATLDVSNNLISLGGIRLLQLIAEKLPSLVEVKTDGARVDQCELDDLEGILSENRNPE